MVERCHTFRLLMKLFSSILFPNLQIVLLTDRDLQCDALKRRGDVTVIERADAPTAKQVAVIWVQEDGLAPKVSGKQH